MCTEFIRISKGISGKVVVNKVKNFQVHTTRGIPYNEGEYLVLKNVLLDGVSEVEGLRVQIIKRSVPEDDRK